MRTVFWPWQTCLLAQATPAQIPPTMCRGSTAGRALFNLYRGHDIRKQYGVQTRQRNADLSASRMAIADAAGQQAAGTQPRSTPSSRAHVAVPSFKRHARPSSAEIAEAQLATVPRRKAGALIAREVAEQQERDDRAAPPVATGPLLDEREKERCAMLMQHRGKVPQLSPAELQRLRRQAEAAQPVSRCANGLDMRQFASSRL